MQIDLLESHEAELAEILVASVTAGASVGFLRPLDRSPAEAFWRSALADPAAVTLVARTDGRIVGTVGLRLAMQQNGRHRAEVVKLLVHPQARGRGVAAALMAALEEEALVRGRTTLVLDTETGCEAEHLYERWGWQRVGEIPAYALSCDGVLCSTTVMTKQLAG